MMESLQVSANYGLFLSLIVLFSLAVGSLLNVVIHRLPQMLRAEFINDCRLYLSTQAPTPSPINLFFPRSFCPNCKQTISAWQNIPLFSYFFLRGKCGHCQHSISLRYPLVEALTAGLSLIAVWHFGLTISLVYVLVFLWILIALLFIDLDNQILPDCLTLSLLWIGLLANLHQTFVPLDAAIIGAATGYVSLWLFNALFYLLSGKIGMGNGDFKLFAALGAWVGWQQLPLIIFSASLMGAVVGSIYLRWNNKKRCTPIPFGPFLCLTGFVSLFWGQELLDLYLKKFF